MKEIDLVTKFNFLLEGLYYDGLNTSNKIIFDYSTAYPRKFILKDSSILKIIEYCTKIFLYSTKNTKILISFQLTNYDTSMVYFRIFIRVNKNLDNLNRKYISMANELSKKHSINTIIKKDEIAIDIKIQLSPNIKENNIKLKNNDIKKYKAVVAYNDLDSFEILSSQLKAIGIEIKPKNDYQTLIKHLKDGIYKPNIIFLHKKIVDNKQDFDEILKLKKVKKFHIVVICDNDSYIDDVIKKEITILRQPYTYDTLCSILNSAHSSKINTEDKSCLLGGGGAR